MIALIRLLYVHILQCPIDDACEQTIEPLRPQFAVHAKHQAGWPVLVRPRRRRVAACVLNAYL